MGFLLGAIFCNIFMTFVLKYAEMDQAYSRGGTLSFNYLLATGISYYQVARGPMPLTSGATGVLGMGLCNGVLFILALYLIQKSIALNDASLTSTFNRMGIFIPTLASILFFKERPTGIQGLGLALAMTCIVLLVFLRKKKSPDYKTLIYLLVTSGCIDLLNKIFSVYWGEAYKNHYVFYTFAGALLVSLVVNGRKKTKYRVKDMVYGFFIGLPNQINNLMLVKATILLPGYLVFPGYSGGIIILVNLTNYLLFKKKLGPKELAISLLLVFSLVLIGSSL